MLKSPLAYGLVLLLSGFAAGIAMGLYLGERSSVVTSNGSTTVVRSDGFINEAARDRVEQNMIYTKRIKELEEEVKALKSAKATEGKTPFAFLKNHHDTIRMNAFSQGLEVTPEMVELLNLSKDEKKAIEDDLRNTRNRMKDLSDEIAQVTSQTPTNVSLEVLPDPRGKEIRDQLVNQLNSVVGADRTDVLMNYGDFSNYTDFSDFAQTKTEMTLSWKPGNNNEMVYTSTISSFGANGSQGTTTQSSTVIPHQWQRYVQAPDTSK